MFCSSCGKEIKSDAKFCPYCGEACERINAETKVSVSVEQGPSVEVQGISAQGVATQTAASTLITADSADVKKKKKKKIIKIVLVILGILFGLGVLAVAAVILFIVLIVNDVDKALEAQKISIADNVDVTFYGDDGEGCIDVCFTDDTVDDISIEYTGGGAGIFNIEARTLMGAVQFETEDDGSLSNGDVIKIKAVYDEEFFYERYGIEFKDTEFVAEVEGLD